MRRFAETTTVTVVKSRAQIEHMLDQHKCQQFGTAIDHYKHLARVQFRAYERIVRFEVKLPESKNFRTTKAHEQEERRVWRSLLLVIKAKLEAVETGIATFEQEFLANIVMPNDRTIADLILPHVAEAYSTGRMPLALGPKVD